MTREENEEGIIYKVVVNQEEQYSIWQADREMPLGWNDAGKSGTKAECLAYIKEVWTDMRPLSLRRQMEAAARRRAEEPSPAEPRQEEADGGGTDLVSYLSEGDHPVEVSLRPEKTAEALRERVRQEYVHLKFTDTQGHAELGVKLDSGALDLSRADFENRSGTLHLEGGLTLDYRKVRCVADIDLATLSGRGRLVVLEG